MMKREDSPSKNSENIHNLSIAGSRMNMIEGIERGFDEKNKVKSKNNKEDYKKNDKELINRRRNRLVNERKKTCFWKTEEYM